MKSIADENLETSLLAAGVALSHGKMVLPEWCTRVKIDVGLSHDAPQARRWIECDPNVYVIAFEPIEKNRFELKKNFIENPEYKFSEHLKRQLIVLPFALSDVDGVVTTQMFVTMNDPGCSSLLEPAEFEVADYQQVEVTSLNSILSYFPFELIPFIDHLKTDAQGSDFDIVKGTGDFLQNIVVITSESENSQYKLSNNSNGALSNHLRQNGFELFNRKKAKFRNLPIRSWTSDPTYINLTTFKLIDRNDLFLFQQG